MKYMIMTFGSAEAGLAAKGKDWMLEMIQFMQNLDADLKKSGELVDEQGLADGSQAKTVRIKNGIPVATDGPFAWATRLSSGPSAIVGVGVLRCPDTEPPVVAASGPVT